MEPAFAIPPIPAAAQGGAGWVSLLIKLGSLHKRHGMGCHPLPAAVWVSLSMRSVLSAVGFTWEINCLCEWEKEEAESQLLA